MYEKILESYEYTKQDIDLWFIMATVKDKIKRNKKDDAIECIFRIGKAYMLASILQSDFGEDMNNDIESMRKIKNYLQFDFLENLEGKRRIWRIEI